MTRWMKNSYCNEKGNTERQVRTMYKTKLTNKQEINETTHVVTKHTATLSPHHISLVPLTPINYIGNIQTNILLDMEENHLFLIKQPNITIILVLQKPDRRMAENSWQSYGIQMVTP